MTLGIRYNLGLVRFFSQFIDLAGSQGAGSIDAADIDGDGLKDVVISYSGRGGGDAPVKVLKNHGNGVFGPPVTVEIAGGVQAKFRDINGDSIPDLVWGTGEPFNFQYAMNLGNGTFGPVHAGVNAFESRLSPQMRF